jgi:KDO2-lipid IV(A) lauroyltransferase
MQGLRAKSGCLFFERRREGGALKTAMSGQGLLLGLLSDQHAGDGGLRLDFFGRDCSTSPAPAVFARRYRCPLHVSVCYRTALGSWRVEISDEIPLQVGERARTPDEIMVEVNRAFEVAIRRDPANWFWVHRRWKPAPPGHGSSPLGSASAVAVG